MPTRLLVSHSQIGTFASAHDTDELQNVITWIYMISNLMQIWAASVAKAQVLGAGSQMMDESLWLLGSKTEQVRRSLQLNGGRLVHGRTIKRYLLLTTTAFAEILKDGKLVYLGRLPQQSVWSIWREIRSYKNYMVEFLLSNLSWNVD